MCAHLPAPSSASSPHTPTLSVRLFPPLRRDDVAEICHGGFSCPLFPYMVIGVAAAAAPRSLPYLEASLTKNRRVGGGEIPPILKTALRLSD